MATVCIRKHSTLYHKDTGKEIRTHMSNKCAYWFKSAPSRDRHFFILRNRPYSLGTAVAKWLRYCVTNRKVAGLIPAGVIGIFY